MKGIISKGNLVVLISGFLFLKMLTADAQVTEPAVGDNSRNSINWPGMYYGVLPCADCPGIETWITLYKNSTYTLERKYQERSDTALKSSGTCKWDRTGGKITLINKRKGGGKEIYRVGENQLIKMDQQGNPVKGDLAKRYVLEKVNTDIREKYWKLTELNGKPVYFDKSFKREPYLIFKSQDNRVNGNGGCNNFSGTYELKTNNRISMSKFITTLMACPDMETESRFLKVLTKADNYYLHGDTLILNKARMAPLARFVAIYMK